MATDKLRCPPEEPQGYGGGGGGCSGPPDLTEGIERQAEGLAARKSPPRLRAHRGVTAVDPRPAALAAGRTITFACGLVVPEPVPSHRAHFSPVGRQRLSAPTKHRQRAVSRPENPLYGSRSSRQPKFKRERARSRPDPDPLCHPSAQQTPALFHRRDPLPAVEVEKVGCPFSHQQRDSDSAGQLAQLPSIDHTRQAGVSSF